MALTEDIFGVLERWSPAAGARTWKFDCIITLNVCLLRPYIADILHRGLATTQAIRYFHSNRSRGNLFTLASKTYKQFGEICFKLDYRFTLLFAFLISVYKSLYLFLSLWLGSAHTSPSPPPPLPFPFKSLRALVGHLSFCFGKAANAPRWVGPGVHTFTKTPRWGFSKKTVQMPYPGTTPKLHFPAYKLRRPYLWKIICNTLIKLALELPYSNSY